MGSTQFLENRINNMVQPIKQRPNLSLIQLFERFNCNLGSSGLKRLNRDLQVLSIRCSIQFSEH